MQTTRSRNTGFILAATIWFLAIASLALGFYALWMERALRQAGAMRADMQAEIDMQSTQATLLYLLTTQYMTIAGLTVPDPLPAKLLEEKTWQPTYPLEDEFGMPTLYPRGNEIRLDDRVYQGIGTALFSLQDERGLINVDFSRAPLGRLLGLLGVPGEARAPLLDKLDDYLDPDTLHRLNGAERQHYQEAGLDWQPTNRLLRTPLEAWRILDWPQYPRLWQEWPRLATVARYTGLPNFNTAPVEVLQTFDFIGAEEAARIVAAREGGAILSEQQLYAVIGKYLGLDEMETNLFPSEFLRLRLWHPQGRYLRQVHLRLSPFVEQQKPWQIEYSLELPLTVAQRQTAAPQPSTLFTAAPRE